LPLSVNKNLITITVIFTFFAAQKITKYEVKTDLTIINCCFFVSVRDERAGND
jgi:hypothetical protein